MFKIRTIENQTDELNRCRDRGWLSIEDEKRFGVANPLVERKYLKTPYDGHIHIGQKVFAQGEQFIGLITKMFLSPRGEISYLAVRAARLFGKHKMVPIEMVSDVTPTRLLLSITPEQFQKLPDYRTDADIAEDVDRALWGDLVLRSTDYREIDTQVRDGVITLNGHVTTGMNKWRAETAVKEVPGIIGINSYLIPDDRLALMVAEAVGQIVPWEAGIITTKVENGLVVLIGEVRSPAIRDQAEQQISEIPWVRGIINELRVQGTASNSEDTRFLQPLIGKELLFFDAVSVTVRKVIINPLNRRVVAAVVLGQFPSPDEKARYWDYRDAVSPEQLMVLPVASIQHLTSTAGFIGSNSDEHLRYQDYVPAQYITPGEDWLPPYPYCTDEVLFLAKAEPLSGETMANAVSRFDNEGGRIPDDLPGGH